MHSFTSFPYILLVVLLRIVWAAPIIYVAPGDQTHGLKVTGDNTLNSSTTRSIPSNQTQTRSLVTRSGGQLPLAFVNNLSGGAINAYITGLDSNNRVVMVKSDGTFYYPPSSNSATPQALPVDNAIPLGAQGSTTSLTIPDYISSARIWFAQGHLQFFTVNSGNGGTSLVEPSAVNPNDPSAAVNWGFVELSNVPNGGLYANISFVDFLGLILGMKLQTGDGNTQGAKGLRTGSVQAICQELTAQTARDSAPWGDLCQADKNGNLLRVLAPADFISNYPSAFSNYWSSYIDQVWSTYTSQPLYIDTQNSPGKVACTVQGDQLQCAGDNRGYSKPSASDIFGCNSGPFAIQGGDNIVHTSVVPRLCAAFHRSALLLAGGSVQPSLASSNYYTTSPTNYYSKLIHQYEIDGKGYAFAYDDVNPAGENQSGVVASPNPQLLTIYVGGDQS